MNRVTLPAGEYVGGHLHISGGERRVCSGEWLSAERLEALLRELRDAHVSPANAIVESSALSPWRESSRVCCTTIGTSASMTLA